MMMSIKGFFKKFWALFAALGAFAVYLIVRNKKPADSLPSEIRSSNDQLADDVDSVRKNEQAALAAEAAEHAEKSEAIKKKYEAEKDKLDAATQAHAEKIFEQHKDDPEALAEELSRVTGFRVILPKE